MTKAAEAMLGAQQQLEALRTSPALPVAKPDSMSRERRPASRQSTMPASP